MIPGFLEKIHAQLFSNIEDKTLAIVKGEQTSYHEFAQLVLSHYSQIKDLPENRIGIVVENDIQVYSAIIACWFSGKSYVPIHHKWPTQRINQICKISGINTIFSIREIDFIVNSISFKSTKLSVINTNLIAPDLKNRQFNEAYVLFTSGTTGEPKGVSISYKNLDSFYLGYEKLNYNICEDDRFLQMFDLTFDLSICSFMIPLSYGASFYTLNEQMVKPLALYDALETHQITFALMIPSSIHLLENYLSEIELPHLRVTQFCGEAFTVNQLQKWQSCVPHCQIDNVYGPTEATIYCTRYVAHPNIKVEDQNGIVCIGEPLELSEMILGEDQEIYIGGSQMTHGYLNNELNEAAFIEINQIKYYKSGDHGRKIDNQYYCLGRKDQQIKVQGYRIELSEIENAFSKIFFNQTSVVLPRQTENNFTEIILFTLTHQDLSEKTILENLKNELPDYMLPKMVVFIEEFKYNANGKLDRNYLKQWMNSL